MFLDGYGSIESQMDWSGASADNEWCRSQTSKRTQELGQSEMWCVR